MEIRGIQNTNLATRLDETQFVLLQVQHSYGFCSSPCIRSTFLLDSYPALDPPRYEPHHRLRLFAIAPFHLRQQASSRHEIKPFLISPPLSNHTDSSSPPISSNSLGLAQTARLTFTESLDLNSESRTCGHSSIHYCTLLHRQHPVAAARCEPCKCLGGSLYCC